MNEQVTQWIFAFSKQFPAVSILLGMMVLDFLMGVTVAYGAKTLSSSASFKGMCKKVAMLLLVMTAGLVDKASGATAAAQMVAMAFIATEAWSILENSARLGIKLPPELIDALSKLRPVSPAPPAQQNGPIVSVEHASNVNIPTQDSTGLSGVSIHKDGE